MKGPHFSNLWTCIPLMHLALVWWELESKGEVVITIGLPVWIGTWDQMFFEWLQSFPHLPLSPIFYLNCTNDTWRLCFCKQELWKRLPEADIFVFGDQQGVQLQHHLNWYWEKVIEWIAELSAKQREQYFVLLILNVCKRKVQCQGRPIIVCFHTSDYGSLVSTRNTACSGWTLLLVPNFAQAEKVLGLLRNRQ